MTEVADTAPGKPPRKTFGMNLSAWVLLPALAILAIVGFIVLGALPGVKLSPDLMERLSGMPVLCVQAGCAIVMAAGFNNLFCYEPCRSIERDWHTLALGGDRFAQWLLIRNDLRWAYLLTLFLVFFWPVR